jgi:hypothetical protein
MSPGGVKGMRGSGPGKLQEQARLEERGQGPPRWELGRATIERPNLGLAELQEWLRLANEEYRMSGPGGHLPQLPIRPRSLS